MEENTVKLLIKKVVINGMHKVNSATYELNDGVTYFIGENGAGKSTILEAIQLALLGYIPGYAKTNESIMKHSSGPSLSVQIEFNNGMKVERTWARLGSSVQSHVAIKDELGNDLESAQLDSLLGEITLPIFNFNEFKSMTANKLKEWFISFMPSSNEELDIRKELQEAANKLTISNELLDEICEWVENSGLSGLELVKALNAKLKSDQSFTKGQIAKLEGTIQSLVKYDDAEDIDPDSVKLEISKLNQLKTSILKYNANESARKEAEELVSDLKSQLDADTFDNDSGAIRLKQEIENLTKKNSVLKADYQDLQSQIQELKLQKASLPKSGSNCPYTSKPCQSAAAIAQEVEEKMKEIDNQIEARNSEIKDCDITVQSKIDYDIAKLQSELKTIQLKYDKLISAQIRLNSLQVEDNVPELSIDEIDNKINDLIELSGKAEANKAYEQLYDTVVADKFQHESNLELYKVWIKRTDANGLQTALMNKPFEQLEQDMSTYLTPLFGRPTVAKFNLVAKANSFSFGAEYDGNYIEFDYLSSGERCLFTLALMMCILDKSNSTIRTILIDDILDHLDTTNASCLFEVLKDSSSIQFILAGVKECDDINICKPV